MVRADPPETWPDRFTRDTGDATAPGGLSPADAAAALRHDWWIVLGLPALVLGASVLLGRPSARTFEARSSLALAIPADLVIPGSDASAAKVGETLVDDIARVVGGDVFRRAVQARVGTDSGSGPDTQSNVTATELSATLSATDRHRVLDLAARRSVPSDYGPMAIKRTKAEVLEVAQAADDELIQNGSRWFSLLGAGSARIELVDAPDVVELPPTLRQRLDLPIRMLAALVIGCALALVRRSRDARIRSADDTAWLLGDGPLGSIPGRAP